MNVCNICLTDIMQPCITCEIANAAEPCQHVVLPSCHCVIHRHCAEKWWKFRIDCPTHHDLLENNRPNKRLVNATLKHILLLDDVSDDNHSCPVCLEHYPRLRFNCRHATCVRCCKAIIHYSTGNCPICRQAINELQLNEQFV